MSKLRILVVDDQYASKGAMQIEFHSKIDCNDIDFEFCQGQKIDGEQVVNDYNLIKQHVNLGWGATASNQWTVVLLDKQFDSKPMKSEDDSFGVEVYKKLKHDYPSLPIVMLTSHHEKHIPETLNAPYLSKDNINIYELTKVLIKHSSISVSQARALLGVSDAIVFESKAMLDVYLTSTQYAKSDNPILILGESGSGKELLAKYIHQKSLRSGSSYVPINMANITKELFEAEFFGYARGAYSGANKDTPGLVESANGGTLFLDEIGDLDVGIQAKLFRFIQEGKFRRLGETAERTVNCRILTATNLNLDNMVKEGTFREEFKNRINTLTITIPSLADRNSDIIPLAQYFLKKEMNAVGMMDVEFTYNALNYLKGYSFSGNVRQLENVIKRLVVKKSSNEVIKINDIDEALSSDSFRNALTNEPGLSDKANLNIIPERRSSTIVTLATLHEVIAGIDIEENDEALRGVVPRLQEAVDELLLSLIHI